jgi:hypothetical protein
MSTNARRPGAATSRPPRRSALRLSGGRAGASGFHGADWSATAHTTWSQAMAESAPGYAEAAALSSAGRTIHGRVIRRAQFG